MAMHSCILNFDKTKKQIFARLAHVSNTAFVGRPFVGIFAAVNDLFNSL